jgi:peptide/nickel transport system permease protein
LLHLVARRLGILILSLLVASIVVFLVLRALPGDPAVSLLGTRATPAAVAQLRHQLGLDAPLWWQYLGWVGGMLHGDFGTSYVSNVPVGDEISQRLLVSVPLAVMGMVLSLVIALPLGLAAATNHRRWPDTVVSAISQLGIAVPAFWAGILLITLFAVKLNWFPAGGFTAWGDDPVGALRSLLLPAISLALVQGAILARYVRSAVLDVMREDFIRTAMANGMTRRQALWRHGLRNAALPLVTILGLQWSYLLVGAIVIESVFDLPGLGRLLLQAIANRDLLVVQGSVMVVTVAVLFVNFLADVSYGLLDPRLRARA